ncbi:MAG TPA: hypothetical protein ENH41_02210, partial [Candidatus Omnitrophica bacterium]|nr:hypothetical protein [Candidatus Omnitrophota bacterium]
MKNLLRRILFLSCICVLSIAARALAEVPQETSNVYVQDSQLIIEKRLENGSLDSPKVYTIKGVTWSPATRAPSRAISPIDPTSIIDYGFFFNWGGRVPQGHEILAFWKKRQFQEYYTTDLPLMKEMNVNTVRVYEDFGDDPDIYNEILDECYRNNIMVIMTVAIGVDDLVNQTYLNIVEKYKNHPAILMWSLGNEWNLNRYYYYGGAYSMENLISMTNIAAGLIKQLDPSHPVSSCLGDRFDLSFDSTNPCGWRPEENSDIPHIVNNCSNVDLWGINVYRGASFNNIFSQWLSAWGEENPKPFYFSEFGTDSYWSTTFTTPYQCQSLARVDSGWEHQDEQEAVFFLLWNEITNQLSSVYPDALCLGGLIHEFNDELWKVGCFHTGLGDPFPQLAEFVDYNNNTSYDEYNTQGFALYGGHRDNVANEEYFGVVDADRNPKRIFYQAQLAFQETLVDTTPPSTPDVLDSGDYTQSTTELFASWESDDPESGVSGYFYCIGTAPFSDDVLAWNSEAVPDTSVTASGLSLTNNATYYFNVKAINAEGLISQVGYSDGIVVKSLSVAITDVTLTLVKNTIDTAIFLDAFTINNSGTSSTSWQLQNNQDGTYTPVGGSSESVSIQGFGFYESSGGIAAGDTSTIRAYINNNKPVGLYQGSYTLKQIIQETTIEIATIYFYLTVEEAKESPDIRFIWPRRCRPGGYVWICGNNFKEVDDLSRVQLSGSQETTDAQIIIWRNRYIVFKVPYIASGDYELCVINSSGESEVEHFKITLPSPRITWMWSNRGRKGRYVRIYGRDFGDRSSASKVLIYKRGSSGYGSIVSWKDGRIIFKVPQLKKRGWHKVRVYTPDG